MKDVESDPAVQPAELPTVTMSSPGSAAKAGDRMYAVRNPQSITLLLAWFMATNESSSPTFCSPTIWSPLMMPLGPASIFFVCTLVMLAAASKLVRSVLLLLNDHGANVADDIPSTRQGYFVYPLRGLLGRGVSGTHASAITVRRQRQPRHW